MPVSEEKLRHIRELAAKDPLDFVDSEIARHVAEYEAEHKWTRFAGHSTFLNAPVSDDLDAVDIGLVGVPFDLGVINRTGPRFGPKQIRELSYAAVNGPYVHETSHIMPHKDNVVRDIGDIILDNQFSLEAGIREIEVYYENLVAHNVTPISAGGDHSITYPILCALGKTEPVGLVQFDAHCDTLGPLDGAKYHHGAPFLNAAVDGVLDPERTIQIGIRGPGTILWGFAHASGMRVIEMEEFDDMGLDAVIAEIHRVIGDGPTYVTVDVDGMDPGFTPGTGTPEVGGMTPLQVQRMIRSLAGCNLVGGDVVEVSPPFDPSGTTAMVGGRMMWELLCVISASVMRKRG